MGYLRKIGSKIGKDRLFGYILLAPTLLLIAVLILLPLAINIYMSFTNQEFFSLEYSFTGIKNYVEVLGDNEFRDSIMKSLVWVLGNAGLQLTIALLTALILNQPIKGQRMLRTLVILPWITPTIIIAVMWKWMLNASFGVVNYLLKMLNISNSPINFLGDPKTAFSTIIFINSWQWFPFFCVLILAALQMIPKEIEEAAKVDGASSFQRFRHIIMPSIQPTLSAVGLIGILLGFNIFDLIWFLTKGGPGTSTTTVPLYIYETGFRAFKLGVASTQSTIILILVLFFVFIYWKLLHPFSEESVLG